MGSRAFQVVVWGFWCLLEGLSVEIDCLSVVLRIQGLEALIGEGSRGGHPGRLEDKVEVELEVMESMTFVK